MQSYRIVMHALAGWLISLTCFHAASDDSLGEKGNIEGIHELIPEIIPDPLEPFNRGVGLVNHSLMMGIIRPSGSVYRTVVIPPLRKGISNFSHNLAYPVRLLNNLLQGQWEGAGIESKRFILNSSFGVGGIFDPATRDGLGRSNQTFQDTLRSWGWRHHAYFMVPLTGPSSDRGVAGSIADRFANPSTYMSPLPFLFSCHSLAENMPFYEQFTASEADPYWLGKEAWAYLSDMDPNQETDWIHEPDTATQTLETLFLSPRDPRFVSKRRTLSIRVPESGKRLRYTYWMQPKPAPLVYFLPGLGGHRRSGTSAALAEMFFRDGFSVVTVSSVYNEEYISNGAPTPLPGHSKSDTEGLLRVLSRIDRQMGIDFPNRISSRVLSGVSMGGFHTLCLAADQQGAREQGLLAFDHYLAVHAPVDLLYGMRQLDAYFHEPMTWDPDTRREKIQYTLNKTAWITRNTKSGDQHLPYGAEEARYLIGLSFRLVLRDLIYASQSRENIGVLTNKVGVFRRQAVYTEILSYDYMDYFTDFLLNYYRGAQPTKDALESELRAFASLRNLEKELSNCANCSVYINANDFLLAPGDLDWLDGVFSKNRLSVFPDGGHLGNLWRPEVQERILSCIAHLKNR